MDVILTAPGQAFETVEHVPRGPVNGTNTNDGKLPQELRHLEAVEHRVSVRVAKPPALKALVPDRRNQTIEHTLAVVQAFYLFALLSLKNTID